jgi:xanthine/uracil/vitamin C permease (AzgA family)
MNEWGIASDIRKIVSDDAGNLSSKRVLAVSWGMSVLFVWIYVSVKGAVLAAIPWEVAGMIFSLASVVAAGKWGEKPTPPAA